MIARFRAEIAGRLQSGELMTGPDLGTSEDDFAGLPTPGGDDGVATKAVGGLPAEELLTGIGVASALEAALPGGLDGRTIALQGFGKMGASIARAVDARGGRIVAVSTLAGCAVAPPGQWFPVAQLLEARDAWGDDLVHHLRARAHPRYAVWAASCDALVPGARPGSLNRHTARHVAARVVVPVANAPYTAGGLDTLEARGIEAHADFVTSGGGAMAYLAPAVAQADGVDAARDAIDAIMHAIVEETRAADIGPVRRRGRHGGALPRDVAPGRRAARRPPARLAAAGPAGAALAVRATGHLGRPPWARPGAVRRSPKRFPRAARAGTMRAWTRTRTRCPRTCRTRRITS